MLKEAKSEQILFDPLVNNLQRERWDVSDWCTHASSIRMEKVSGGQGLMGTESGGDSL